MTSLRYAPRYAANGLAPAALAGNFMLAFFLFSPFLFFGGLPVKGVVNMTIATIDYRLVGDADDTVRSWVCSRQEAREWFKAHRHELTWCEIRVMMNAYRYTPICGWFRKPLFQYVPNRPDLWHTENKPWRKC